MKQYPAEGSVEAILQAALNTSQIRYTEMKENSSQNSPNEVLCVERRNGKLQQHVPLSSRHAARGNSRGSH